MKKTFLNLFFVVTVLIACLPQPEVPLPFPTLTSIQGITISPVVPPTHTPIYVPTLGLENQQEFYEFLASNGGYELPCLWGITPGETFLYDAFEIIRRFVVNPKFAIYQIREVEPRNGYSKQVIVTTPLYLNNSLNIDSTSQAKVRGLDISTFSTGKESYLPLESEYFEKYSLLNVFEKLGVPDAIYINPPIAPRIQDVYSLYVLYENQKLFLNYYGVPEEISDGIYDLCPNIGDEDILILRIVVADPTDPRIHIIPYALQQFSLESTYPPEILEREVELDARKIYNRFIHQGNYCFQYDGYQNLPIY